MKRLMEFVLMCLMSAMFAVLIIEWFAGCGETYIDADGKRHAHECVFVGKYQQLPKH